MSFLQGLFGPPDVAKLEAKRDVPGLIKALGYEKDLDWGQGHLGKEQVRSAAAKALGQIGDARAVEPLIAALQDSSPSVREAVPEALVKIGRPAVELLVVALKDGAKDVRYAAAKALSQIGDIRAVEPLAAALKDSDSQVRCLAAAALGQLGDARAVEPLAATLKDSDMTLRRYAVEALGQIGDTRAVAPLLVALKDGEEIIRQYVAQRLAHPTQYSPVPIEELIREDAAQALGRIGDARAVKPLIAALQDNYSGFGLRKEAAKALGQIGDARADEPLGVVALKHDGDVSYAATEALGQIGDARAVELLGMALKDGNLIAVWALEQIGDARAVKLLGMALKDDVDASRAVVEALGRIGGTRAVEPLVVALKNSRWDVCSAAAAALSKLAWHPGKDEIGARYYIQLGKWDKCIELGAPAVEPLIAALEADQCSVRKAAAKALVNLYRSGRLDNASASRILDQRGTITLGHSDRTDCVGHHDTGIDVSFPL